MFPLPTSLQQLLDAGRWPRSSDESLRQNLRLLVPVERIRQFAPEEDGLYLLAPPFQSVAECASTNSYWLHPRDAPSEMNVERTLYIGEVGLGWEGPLLLDYSEGRAEPRILRLRWSERGTDNHWVEVAPDFDSFASTLGLLPIA